MTARASARLRQRCPVRWGASRVAVPRSLRSLAQQPASLRSASAWPFASRAPPPPQQKTAPPGRSAACICWWLSSRNGPGGSLSLSACIYLTSGSRTSYVDKVVKQHRVGLSAAREHRIDKLTASAADLHENDEYDLLLLHQRGVVRVRGTDQSITQLYGEVENLIRRRLRVIIKPGTYFVARGNYQNMATRAEYRFSHHEP